MISRFRLSIKSVTKLVCLHLSFQLARRGLDVVLISRSDDKLQMVSKEIGESNEKDKIIVLLLL